MSKARGSNDLKEFCTRWEDVIKRFGGEEKVAQKAGFSKQTVHKWLVGDSRPDIVLLCQACTNLGISADYLLGLTKKDNYSNDEMARLSTEYTGLNSAAVKTLHEASNSFDCMTIKMLNMFFDREEWMSHKVDQPCNDGFREYSYLRALAHYLNFDYDAYSYTDCILVDDEPIPKKDVLLYKLKRDLDNNLIWLKSGIWSDKNDTP